MAYITILTKSDGFIFTPAYSLPTESIARSASGEISLCSEASLHRRRIGAYLRVLLEYGEVIRRKSGSFFHPERETY